MLYPISVTQPDWSYLKKAIAESMNLNIDSPLINNQMTKNLGAFLGTLGLNGDPKMDMRRGMSRSLKHVNLGFAMIVESDVMSFMVDSGIHTTVERLQTSNYFIIATGDLLDWLTAAGEACQKHQEQDLRLMFNKIIIYMDNIGLKQVVNMFTKTSLPDKTLILKRK